MQNQGMCKMATVYIHFSCLYYAKHGLKGLFTPEFILLESKCKSTSAQFLFRNTRIQKGKEIFKGTKPTEHMHVTSQLI